MEPELGQPGELLLDGELHVMSRDAFMVSDRLVVDERALGKIRSGNDDAARTLAVGRASDVMSCTSGLERRYGFDGDWRLRKQREELRELGLHLGDVAAEIVKDLVGGSRNVFGIRLE